MVPGHCCVRLKALCAFSAWQAFLLFSPWLNLGFRYLTLLEMPSGLSWVWVSTFSRLFPSHLYITASSQLAAACAFLPVFLTRLWAPWRLQSAHSQLLLKEEMGRSILPVFWNFILPWPMDFPGSATFLSKWFAPQKPPGFPDFVHDNR